MNKEEAAIKKAKRRHFECPKCGAKAGESCRLIQGKSFRENQYIRISTTNHKQRPVANDLELYNLEKSMNE